MRRTWRYNRTRTTLLILKMVQFFPLNIRQHEYSITKSSIRVPEQLRYNREILQSIINVIAQIFWIAQSGVKVLFHLRQIKELVIHSLTAAHMTDSRWKRQLPPLKRSLQHIHSLSRCVFLISTWHLHWRCRRVRLRFTRSCRDISILTELNRFNDWYNNIKLRYLWSYARNAKLLKSALDYC